MTSLSHFVVVLLLLSLPSPSAPSSAEADRESHGSASTSAASPFAFASASSSSRPRRFALAYTSLPFRGGGGDGSGARTTGGVHGGDGDDDRPDEDDAGEEGIVRRRLLADLKAHHSHPQRDGEEEDDITFDLGPATSGMGVSNQGTTGSGGDGGGGVAATASRRARDFLNGLASSPTFRDEYWARRPFLIRAEEVARLSSSSGDDEVGAEDGGEEASKGGSASASPSPSATSTSTSATGSWIEGMFTLERDLRMIDESYITGHRTADILRNGTKTDTWAFNPLKDDATRKTTWGDVEDALNGGTVYFNSAGSLWPNLAALCRLSDRAFGLPSTVNVYVTPPNLPISVPPHTDRQDVLVFQTEGRKRWRVYRPPKPRKRGVDPLNRGKNGDVLDAERECGEPVIDAVLSPGDCMYVPAGFPHTTDTVDCGAGAEEGTRETCSVHLTMGLDTHVFGLTYAHLRWCALRRSGKNHNVDIGSRSDDVYWRTVGTVPLGFLGGDGWRERTRRMMATPRDHAVVCDREDEANPGGEGAQALLDKEASLFRKYVSNELRRVMVLLEPDRWRVDGVDRGNEAMPSEEELGEVVDFVIRDHLRPLLEVQEETYRAVDDPRSEDGILNAYRGAQDVNAFMEKFAKFASANDVTGKASQNEGVVTSG